MPKPPNARRRGAEEKIKAAARALFTKNGFAATRTRDIARQAGVNLALLNYYFGSKEELFSIIMMENYGAFLHGLSAVLNHPDTSVEAKITAVVSAEIDLLTRQPDLPIFILNAVVSNPGEFIRKVELDKIVKGSFLFRQIRESGGFARTAGFDPLHLIINLVALTIAPFVMAPVIQKVTGTSRLRFKALMAERKRLIPRWLGLMADPQGNTSKRTPLNRSKG